MLGPEMKNCKVCINISGILQFVVSFSISNGSYLSDNKRTRYQRQLLYSVF